MVQGALRDLKEVVGSSEKGFPWSSEGPGKTASRLSADLIPPGCGTQTAIFTVKQRGKRPGRAQHSGDKAPGA